MKEFMLLIRNEGDAKASLTKEKHFEFIKQCEVYINNLKQQNRLIAAQPLAREGVILSDLSEGWKEVQLNPRERVQVGYYHILAENMNEAIAIAKENPEFEYVHSATIEIRPIKTTEKETNFVYPTGAETTGNKT
jgi:hypothetical protein